MNTDDALYLGEALLSRHGLLEEGWGVQLDSAKSRFGCCSYTYKRITLSRALVRLNDESTVRGVLLHEVAHALAGAGSGHGPRWRRICLAIGGDGKRTYDGDAVVTPPKRYNAACAACGKTYNRIKRPQRGATYLCPCRPRLRAYVLVWVDSARAGVGV